MGIIILMKFLDILAGFFMQELKITTVGHRNKRKFIQYDGADNFGLGLQVGGRYFFNEILE
jgi:hypothetical protein